MTVGGLTDGSDVWVVLEWKGVREFSTLAKTHSFQIWIGINGDANPGQDITFAYGPNTGNGDGGFGTVGAENKFGNRGDMTYLDGAGYTPVANDEIIVTSVAGLVLQGHHLQRAKQPPRWQLDQLRDAQQASGHPGVVGGGALDEPAGALAAGELAVAHDHRTARQDDCRGALHDPPS